MSGGAGTIDRAFGICVGLAMLLGADSIAWAQSSADELEMAWNHRELKIKARNADLKLVLSRLAETAGISIRYPESLEREITLDKRRISMDQALDILLKGLNHIVIYSGPDAGGARIDEVLVLEDPGKARSGLPPRTGTSSAKRQSRLLASYLRQMNSLKQRLAKVDENSSRGKRYQSSIERLEKDIQRIKDQM